MEGKGGGSWHWNDMHEQQSEQGKRRLCHSLWSLLHFCLSYVTEKWRKTSAKKKLGRVEREGKKGGKTELPNFSSLMFPASEWLYLDDGVSHRVTPSTGIEWGVKELAEIGGDQSVVWRETRKESWEKAVGQKKIRRQRREDKQKGEERDHTHTYLNTRELSTVLSSSLSPCYISQCLHPHCWPVFRDQLRPFTYVCSLLTKEDPHLESTASSSSEEHCCTLANTSVTVALFLLYSCFFMTINLHDVIIAHGSEGCYGDQ